LIEISEYYAIGPGVYVIFRFRSTPVEKKNFGESLTHFKEAVTEDGYKVK
jgi:hypothetical protein